MPHPRWLADPAGIYTHRWHDGTSWTAHVALDGQPATDRGTDPATLPAPSPPKPARFDLASLPPPSPAAPAPPPGRRKPGRGRRIATVTAVTAVILAVLVGLGMLGNELEQVTGGAGTSSRSLRLTGGTSSYDEQVSDLCGPPGSTDYVSQAHCITSAIGPDAYFDNRGLATVARDSCQNVPDIPADDLGWRLGPVQTVRDREIFTIVIRLARIYCGLGDSLDADGFTGTGYTPAAPPDAATVADLQYLDLLIASWPPGANENPDDLIAIGRQICESLADGMPMELMIERGASAAGRPFMYAAITAATSVYCPDVAGNL